MLFASRPQKNSCHDANIAEYTPSATADSTNTVTTGDIEDLRARGARRLITSTPDFGGRSFGTNVVEAALVAFLRKPLDQIGPEVYREAIARLHLRPRLVELNAAA